MSRPIILGDVCVSDTFEEKHSQIGSVNAGKCWANLLIAILFGDYVDLPCYQEGRTSFVSFFLNVNLLHFHYFGLYQPALRWLRGQMCSLNHLTRRLLERITFLVMLL